MRTHILLTLAAACALSVAVAAQDPSTSPGAGKKPFVEAIGNTKETPLPPGGPAPRMADGHVDLSGVWFSGNSGRTLAWTTVASASQNGPRDEPLPYRPDVAAKMKQLSRTEAQMISPGVNCMPKGVPGVFVSNPHPIEILTIPNVFVQLVEVNNDWRKVYTDKRPHPEYPDPRFNGNPSAWWEGDTLVIDSIAFDDRIWVGDLREHSDELRITERIRRPSLNYLEYQYTVQDPKMLSKPWTSSWRTFSLGKEELIENYCTNNENAQEFQKLFQQEAGGNK